MNNITSLSELRSIPPDEPFVIGRVTDTGCTYYVASRINSFRRDLVKMKVCGISSIYCEEEHVIEKNHQLVSPDDRVRYTVMTFDLLKESEMERKAKAAKRIEAYSDEEE